MIQFAQYRCIPYGYSLYVTGDCIQLGQWIPNKAIQMNYYDKDLWMINVNLGDAEKVKYKYFTARTDNPQEVKWDEGENKSLDLSYLQQVNSLNIMTFNIRYDCNEKDEKDNWNYRKNLVTQTIKSVKPDILGLQEVLVHQKIYLEEQLDNYNFIWRGRESDFQSGEGSPIVYNLLKYNLLVAEVFWLSDTPQVAGSKTYGNSIPRICTYAKLQNKQNQEILNVFCTHFDHEHAASREQSAFQIKNRIKENERIIVMGDLNCLPLSKPIKILENEIVNLQNTINLLDIPKATIHLWSGFTVGLHIDYIFVRNIKWNETKILNEKINGRYASDHFAKVAVCQFL